MAHAKRPMEVLLVEDNPADVRLTREAFKECVGAVNLHVTYDGVEAMEYLRHKGKHADASRPDIVVLDLNLPRKDGREVLAEIKSDPGLHQIPVAILTTSRAERDILETYELRANCYLTKPVDLDQFMELVKSFGDFWLSKVCLPTDEGSPRDARD